LLLPLPQAYEHSAVLVSQFASMEITLPFLLQIDKLVQLLESPIFTHVRRPLWI
jgi:vacuole morphology and inheritance protein 14